MNFPDLPHLKQLQIDLWRWPKSRAAVMVGAGFSLNSERLPGVHTKFPTWKQLVGSMFIELHPPTPGETPAQAQERVSRFQGTNALRLASEYEAAFGRRKLDLLIQTKNPDSDHQPGNLHRLLMKLPWADVFTTNYDTLLERVDVPGRSYQPVTKASELTTAFAPRIVKLHGSFPSQTSYIITEDDYRTYPAKFAPFVNSVQQSLIENAFVLIGFSGHDPNFLAWTGWIRDQLGENHAPIYLVGALDLGNAERSLLARRGVTPIDLSPVFLGKNAPNDIHAASIQWFLQCLGAAKPPRPEKWPENNPRQPENAANQPKIIGAMSSIPDAFEDASELQKPLTSESVGRLLCRWQYERINYPRWVVATDGKRSMLWDKTKFWIQPLAAFVKDWSASDRLLVFNEINWRIETAMVPLFPNSINPFKAAVVDFFANIKDGNNVFSLQIGMPFESASTQEVYDAWFQIAFGLLREARETYNEVRWIEIKEQIDQAVTRYPQHEDRNHYEGVLWAMWKIERNEAKNLIAKWQSSPSNPVASIWKAGLLAELDELGESRSLLRGALGEIRKALNTQGRNIELLSLEGWCTFLLFGVEQVLDFAARPSLRDEFTELWHELKDWDCNPWPLKEYFDEVLKARQPELPRAESLTHGFDPREVTRTYHWTGDAVDRYLPAFACIRLYEQVGLPMRMGMIDIGSETLATACRWIEPFDPFGSPPVLIRSGKFKSISEADFFSRARVAIMDSSFASRLHEWCFQILEREIISLKGLPKMHSAQEALLEILPEVLSRLAFRLDRVSLQKSFSLAIRFHQLSGIRAHIRLNESSEPWFKRLFLAAEEVMLLEWLPTLLKLPLFDDHVHGLIPEHHVWPDPMRYFPTERAREAAAQNPTLIQKIHQATHWLLRRATSESGEARQRALSRLTNVFQAKLMSPEQKNELGELLWSERTDKGLPQLRNFAVFGFLHLPAPRDVDVQAVVKAYVLSLSSDGLFTTDANGHSTIKGVNWMQQPLLREASLVSKPIVQLRDEALGDVEWTPEETRSLYEKAREWWRIDQVAFEVAKRGAPFGLMGVEPVIRTLNGLGTFLSRAILPRMEWADDARWDDLLSWVEEVRAVGAFPTLVLPYVLKYRPVHAEVFAATIFGDLNSDITEAVVAAAKATRHWLHLASLGIVPSPPASIINALIDRVLFRRRTEILQCLGELTYLLIEIPDAVTNSQVSLIENCLIPWQLATILSPAGNDTAEFPVDERLDLRVSVARLAGAVSVWSEKKRPGVPESNAVRQWRDICVSDPLPEMRRAFNTWKSIIA